MVPNLECRMYEAMLPEVDQPVMIEIKRIDSQMAVYVSLVEYNNIEGMMSLMELSRTRIRSINRVVKVGRVEPAMVLKVEKDKGHVDLSKRRISNVERAACEERYNKSKLVHSILRHVAETVEIDLEDLYVHIGWPLYRKYGHAFEAFKLMVTDPDSVLGSIGLIGSDNSSVRSIITDELKDALVKNIRGRMTPQPLKIRADIELKCFHYDGVLHIKEAMRKAEAAGDEDCPVKVKLVAPPAYVMITQTLDRVRGLEVLNKAIEAGTEEIERHKGKLVVKEAPRVVSEREDRLLAEQMAKLSSQNADISDDDEEEEEEGMGEIDLDKGQGIIE
ncbi:OLC1v1013899C1 [Oldenlandia corymbosa var. corymbosa]|uniref:OLC1v1013899C1 n=1 Tax=Oldenlandia corymbosa var. corymbosa TaxID=529605 RepID=A0AAV1DZV1_OLDCO|nr:OLC1v1013899C1 [Oldenlandia corymbosa var. corymbosa]